MRAAAQDALLWLGLEELEEGAIDEEEEGVSIVRAITWQSCFTWEERKKHKDNNRYACTYHLWLGVLFV